STIRNRVFLHESHPLYCPCFVHVSNIRITSAQHCVVRVMMNQSVILTKYPQLRKTTNAVTTPDPEGHGLLPNTIDGTHSHLSISGIAKCLLLLLLLLLLSCLLYCSGQSGGGEEEPFAATVANIAYVVV